MGVDTYTAVQESLEHARTNLTAFSPGSNNGHHTRNLLKSLDNVQDALSMHLKSKKHKKKKESDKEAEQVRIDWMDTEGVRLWNLASQLSRTTPSNPVLGKDDLAVVAAVRLSGYKLVEAATDIKGPITFIVRLLGLTAKTVTALVEAGKVHVAGQLALQGAEYEQIITSSPPPREAEDIKQQVSVLVWYYMARIDLLLREGNDTFALDLLFKATQLGETWTLSTQDCRLLASKCWTVGNDMLTKRVNLSTSIDWLKQGIMLVEKMVNRGVQEEHLHQLHIAILKSLARAQMKRAKDDHQALAAAAVTLDEIDKLVGEEDRGTLHEMRLLQLHILKTRKAPEGEVRSVLEELLNLTQWTEQSVLEILSLMASLSPSYPSLPSTAIQTLLRLGLANPEGHPHIQLIIYEGLLFVKALNPPAAALRAATTILDMAYKHPDYKTDDKVNVIACQTLLWNIAMFNETKERVVEAALWYALAAHGLFDELGSENTSRCLRKAALCYIRVADYSASLDLISRCPTNEASTHYLSFLTAIRQDRQQAAIDAISAIVACSDFEAQQLILMTSLANEKGSRPVLTAAMRALLDILGNSKLSFELHIETITVVRCLVRMTVMELSKAEDKDALAESLVEYFQTAIDLLTEDPSRGQGQTKGVAWLYKCAYNVAVQGLATLSSRSLADLFDRSAQLMSIHEVLDPLSTDPDLPFVRGSAMFACLCGKIFLCKELPTGPDKMLLLDQLMDYIPHCRDALASIGSSHNKSSVVLHMQRIMDTSEIELLCEAKDWAAIPDRIRALKTGGSDVDKGPACQTLEMCVNVLFRYDDCPSHCTYQLLELIVDSCPTTYASDIKRFSRWLRAILRILLHRSSAEDEIVSLQYMSRALDVLRTSLGKTAYPLDEVHWLVAMAWNRGLEWFSSSRIPQAKEWCEIALTVSSCMPDLKIDREKMHDHYQHLLAKISR